jgi:hypothetical protein
VLQNEQRSSRRKKPYSLHSSDTPLARYHFWYVAILHLLVALHYFSNSPIESAEIHNGSAVFMAHLVRDAVLRKVQAKKWLVLHKQLWVDLAAHKAYLDGIDDRRVGNHVPLGGVGELC